MSPAMFKASPVLGAAAAPVEIKPSRRMRQKQKRVQGIVRYLQNYMNTYDQQAAYLDYSDETIINDVIYALGVSLDETYKFSGGFARFKKELAEHLRK